MRISEKTIEINYCAELTAWLWPQGRTVWFGLTQEQEARAGFDVCARINSRLFILQFKASNKVLRNGDRHFYTPHHQLVALRKLARRSRSVLFVLPTFGNTREFNQLSSVVKACALADVFRLPAAIPPPLSRKGTPRVNGMHYMRLAPGIVTIHSEPMRLETFSDAFWGDLQPPAWASTEHGEAELAVRHFRASWTSAFSDGGIRAEEFDDFNAFWKVAKNVGPNTYAVGI